MDINGKINDYLEHECKDLYFKTIVTYIRKYGEQNVQQLDTISNAVSDDFEEELADKIELFGYKLMLQSVCCKPGQNEECEDNLIKFIIKLFDLVKKDKKKMQQLVTMLSTVKDRSSMDANGEMEVEDFGNPDDDIMTDDEMDADEEMDEELEHDSDEMDDMNDTDMDEMSDMDDDMNDTDMDDMDSMEDQDELGFFEMEEMGMDDTETDDMGMDDADINEDIALKEQIKPVSKKTNESERNIKKEKNDNIDTGISFIEALCDSDGKYSKSIQLLLDNNYNLFFNGKNKAFVYSCKQKNGNDALMILKYFTGDKALFVKLLNQTNGEGVTALELICQNRNSTSSKIIKLILKNNPVLSYNDKQGLLRRMNGYLCKHKNADNLFMILNYFDSSPNTAEFISLCRKNMFNFKEYSPRFLLKVYESYFKGNKAFLLKQLAANKSFLLKKICRFDKYIELFRYILYESELSSKDMLNLINSVKDKSKLFGSNTDMVLYKSGCELVKYLQNDKKKLLKLLNEKYENSASNKISSFWINICMAKEPIYDGFGGTAHTLRNYEIISLIKSTILTNPTLSQRDQFKLLFTKDEEGSTPFVAAMTFCTAKDHRFETLLEIIETNKDLLIKLLSQSSGIENKPAILYCSTEEHLDRIFQILDDKATWKLVSKYPLSKWEYSVKPIVSQWKQYRKLKKNMKNMNENKKLSIAFENDKQYKKNPFIAACRFGKIDLIKKVINKIKSKAKLTKLLTDKNKKKKKNPHDDDSMYSIQTAIDQILLGTNTSSVNDKILQLLLLKNEMFSDKDRIKLLLSAQNGTDYLDRNGYNLNALLSILNYFQNDRKYIQKILAHKKTQQTLLLALNTNVINNNIDKIFKIIDFYRQEKQEWIAALSFKDDMGVTLLKNVACGDDNTSQVMKLMLEDINQMNDELQLKILSAKDFSGKRFIFQIENEKNMEIVFSILNNNIIDKLLGDKEKKNGYDEEVKLTLLEKLQENDDKYDVQKLIERYLDYSKFDKFLNDKTNKDIQIDLLFDEYVTNPFLTSCYLNKETTINKLLNDFIGNRDEENLKLLLLNNFNKQNGNNCLMELAQNDHCNVIINILNFLTSGGFYHLSWKLLSMENIYSKQTLLMILCKNNNVNAITQILNKIKNGSGDNNDEIKKLLKQQDKKNKSCLDYAKPNILSFLNQYFV